MIDEKAMEAAKAMVLELMKIRYKDTSEYNAEYISRQVVAAYEQARCAALPQDRVERVAMAISQWMNCEKLPQPPRWDRLQEATRQAYRDQARAAILAADDAEALVAELQANSGCIAGRGDTSWITTVRAIAIVRQHYGSGAVRSAAERHQAGASAPAGSRPAQEGDALIPESAPATPTTERKP